MKKFFYIFLTIFTLFVFAGCNEENNSKLTIKFETNGGSAISDETIEEKDFSNYKIPSTTRDGYEFKGWFIDVELTQDYEVSSLTSALKSGEITLYANWEKIKSNQNRNLLIKYEANGGLPVTDALVAEEDITNYVLPSTTKEGYEFQGWFLDSDFSNQCSNEKLRLALEQETVTVYAKWKKIETAVCVDHVDLDNDGKCDNCGVDMSQATVKGMWEAAGGILVTFNDNGELDLTFMGQNFAGTYTLKPNGDLEIIISQYGINNTVKGSFLDGKLSVQFGENLLNFERIDQSDYDQISGPININLTFDGLFELNDKLVVDSENSSSQSVGVKLGLELNVEEMKIDDLADLKASVIASVKTNIKREVENPIPDFDLQFKLYINNGIMVVEFPEFLLGTTDDLTKNVKVKFNLSDVLEALMGQTPFAGMSQDEIISMIESAASNYESILEEYGISPELIDDCIETIKILIPQPVYIDNQISYVITQEKIDDFVEAFGKLFEQNIDLIFQIIGPAEQVDLDGNIFVYNQLYWIDANGMKHEYSEDFENQKFGVLSTESDVKIYTPFMVDGYYIVDTEEFVPNSTYKEPLIKDDVLSTSKAIISLIPSVLKVNDLSLSYDLSENKLNEVDAKVDVEIDPSMVDPSIANIAKLTIDLGLKFDYENVVVSVLEIDEQTMDITKIIVDSINSSNQDSIE